MLVQLEILTTLGKLSTDNNSTPESQSKKPLSKACKYILSPCSKTLSNASCDQSISGIFGATKTADKLMKAHCLPLDWTLKRLSPWCILVERNRAILTWICSRKTNKLHPWKSLTPWELVTRCNRDYTTELYYVTGGIAHGRRVSQKTKNMADLTPFPWQQFLRPHGGHHWPTAIRSLPWCFSPPWFLQISLVHKVFWLFLNSFWDKNSLYILLQGYLFYSEEV